VANSPSDRSTSEHPLRVWPGVLIVVLQWLLRFVVPRFVPAAALVGVLAGPAGLAAIVVWWMFFSRAPWSERWGALVLMIVAPVAIRSLTHESIQNGMMGMMFVLYAIPPTLSLAFVVWAVASRRLATGPRRVAMAAAILLGCGVWTLARTDGITGGGGSELAWRWAATAEERLLAQAGDGPFGSARGGPGAPTPAPAAMHTEVDWPGFRGHRRDGVVPGVWIQTDWSKSPPVEMWRRPIGPGWSSFAVRGDLLYTQEQRGEDELVACYRVTTGEPVWQHRDAVRFWESNGGAGPRATPALSGGRVYTLGATGIVNALAADDGAVAWSHNVASDTGVKVPGWGFAGSPLVVGDVVIVAASGALVAYDLASGDRRWFVKSRGGSYSSPHPLTIDGVAQVVLMSGIGATSIAPADGTLLWEHSWEGVPIVQPAVIAGGDLLLTTADAMGGLGIRRLTVAHGAGGWAAVERWTSRGLKPYFNDYVIHQEHAFGFDGNILSCIELANGERKWKGGRYGNGQLVLLPEQDLMLVLSEEGELALVGATPDQFTELARFPGVEGKTWNHPVLVGDVLLVRNAEEMVAFRLSLATR